MDPVSIGRYLQAFVALLGEGYSCDDSCDGGSLGAGEPMKLRAGISRTVRADAVVENDPKETGKSRPLRSKSG